MTSLFDLWQLADKLIIAISIVSFLFGLLRLITSSLKLQKIKQIADASYVRTKPGLRAFIKQYKRYQPHIIIEKSDPESQLTYKHFIHRLTDEPLVFIHGESGSGKSILLQHLACSFRKTLLHPNRDSLFGVFAKPQQSLDDFLTTLRSDISILSAKRIYIFLDGFDEIREINQGSDANDLILKVRGIFDNHFPGKTFCLIMTSRIEVFNNITRPEDLGFSVFKLQKLNNRQIIRIYKKCSEESLDISFNYRGSVKRKNINRLKAFLGYRFQARNEVSDSIFCIPFIVQYADVLFSISSDAELRNANQYDILKKIIHDFWLEREYVAYSKIEVDPAKRIPKDVYKEKTNEFINSIVAILYYQKKSFICFDDIPFPKDAFIDRQCLITRSLLVLVGNEQYTFVHQSIFEFFIAEFMATSIIDYKDCACYLFSGYTEHLLQLFCGAIYANSILLSNILAAICRSKNITYRIWQEIFMLPAINISLDPQCITIDKLILYLPNLKKLTCGNLALSDSDLFDLRTSKALDLEGQYNLDFSVINRFGYIEELYLDKCKISNLSSVLFQNNYRVLSLCENPIASYEALSECSIYELRVSVNNITTFKRVVETVRFTKLFFDAPRLCAMYSYAFETREKLGLDILPVHRIKSKISDLVLLLRVQSCNLHDIFSAYILERLSFPERYNGSIEWMVYINSLKSGETSFMDAVCSLDIEEILSPSILHEKNVSTVKWAIMHELVVGYSFRKFGDRAQKAMFFRSMNCFEVHFWESETHEILNFGMIDTIKSIVLNVLDPIDKDSYVDFYLDFHFYIHMAKYFFTRKEYIKTYYALSMIGINVLAVGVDVFKFLYEDCFKNNILNMYTLICTIFKCDDPTMILDGKYDVFELLHMFRMCLKATNPLFEDIQTLLVSIFNQDLFVSYDYDFPIDNKQCRYVYHGQITK